MTSNLDKYRQELERLLKTCKELVNDFAEVVAVERGKKGKSAPGSKFMNGYQMWYSEAHEVIRQILPNRLAEFEMLYEGGKRKTIGSETYTIQDWLLGRRAPVSVFGLEEAFDDAYIVSNRLHNQFLILESARARFESALFDIKQLVQADIFDSEIESARELLKNGFLRAAGAVAGVVLEKHLGQVCQNHNIPIKKKAPTISDFNDALKNQDIIETHDWRFIQRLGALRNLCDHDKQRDPSKDEVAELIEGVGKIMKTLF